MEVMKNHSNKRKREKKQGRDREEHPILFTFNLVVYAVDVRMNFSW